MIIFIIQLILIIVNEQEILSFNPTSKYDVGFFQ